MSIFDMKKKEDAFRKLAQQSLTSTPLIPEQESSNFMNKVRSFFSLQKEKKGVILKIPTGETNGFYCKEKPQPEDIMQCTYSAVFDTKTFNTIKNTSKRRNNRIKNKDNNNNYKGRNIDFINVNVQPSKDTEGIIQECIHKENSPLSSKQQVQTMPQLCKHYLLTDAEIRTLCYIVYDCNYIHNDEEFKNQNPISIARYFCKERRHILRFTIVEYASLMQHITITHANLNTMGILAWINAIGRIVQIITALTPIQQDYSLLTALIWLPRKALISLTQGRTIDKTLLTYIKNHNTITLEEIQSHIIIIAVARIITEQFDKTVTYDPIPLLLKIDNNEYMETPNPILSLLKIFREIQGKYVFLLQSKTQYFMYALEYITTKNDSDNILSQLQEVNTILYTVLRIEQLYNRSLTEEEVIAIINKLSESTIDIIRFYGINPKEFFLEEAGFYFSTVQLLAYMQYNKINQVTPQTAVLMKFIPLQLYKNSEKPYEELQKECNTIVQQCPHILDINEIDLENICFEKLLLSSIETERSIAFFQDIERVVIALQKIREIQTHKTIQPQELLHTLCILPPTTLSYIKHFPEVFFSPILHEFPNTLLDGVYNELQEYCKTKSFHYKILACFISPLSILEDVDTLPHIENQDISLYTTKAISILEAMNSSLSCREKYTNDILFKVLTLIMPLYYKYPLPTESWIRLVNHANEILEIITEGSTIPLEELCSKPKSFLHKYRKEQQEHIKERL